MAAVGELAFAVVLTQPILRILEYGCVFGRREEKSDGAKIGIPGARHTLGGRMWAVVSRRSDSHMRVGWHHVWKKPHADLPIGATLRLRQVIVSFRESDARG